MKRIKAFAATLAATFAAVTAMALLPETNALTAHAEGPTTYYMTYDSDKGEWRYEISEDDNHGETGYTRELYYYYENAKDGDIVVVNNTDDNAPQLDLGSIRLSNVTILFDSAFTMIKAGSIDDFFALARTSSSITAPIVNAHVADPSVVNFNNNVQNIIVAVTEGEPTFTLGCAGTVGSLQVSLSDQTGYTLYNFAAGTLLIRDGSLQTDEEHYSRTPSASTAPTTPTTPPSSGSSSSSDEYDSVPKTGGTNPVIWLLCAAAVCMAASLYMKKASK